MLGRLRAGVLDVSEIHRFVNEPVRQNGSLHWDVLRIWLEIKQGMERAAATPVDSVGVDAWGCDYALVGEQGVLLQNPYHYRDKRTDGVMEAVFERVPADEIYAVTGIQFLPFNTLYQLYAACRATPRLIDAATSFGTIPDLVNYWLTGEMTAEFTNATTTQFIDARTRSWATDLLRELDVPTRILPRVVEPGTHRRLRRRRRAPLAPRHAGRGARLPRHRVGGRGRARRRPPRVSELGHVVAARDRAARAGDHAARARAELHERRRRLRDDAAAQEHRRPVAAAGVPAQLGGAGTPLRLRRAAGAGAESRHGFRSLFDPDHPTFLHPRSMVSAIARLLPRDRSAGARRAGRVRARDPREPGLQVPRRARIDGGADRHRHHRDSHRRRRLAQPAAESVHRRRHRPRRSWPGRSKRARSATSPCRWWPPKPWRRSPRRGRSSNIRSRSSASSPSRRTRWNAHYRRFQEYLEPTCV